MTPVHRGAFSKRAFYFAFAGVLACAACGSRSELLPGSARGSTGGSGGMPPQPLCTSDLECGQNDACALRECIEGQCVVFDTQCDDGDVCTDDACDPARGCVFSPLTFDNDGDGFKAPRAGFAPGQPNACGNDCDDRSAAAFPGNTEVCDGVDNDCNGVVDDEMTYVASKPAPLRVSTAEGDRASAGALLGTPDGFVLTYATVTKPPFQDELTRAFIKGLRSDGSTRFERAVSELNAESYPGVLAWSGQVIVNATSDARQFQNYEIYLNRFSKTGEKLSADQRVTDAPGFSKRPSIQWTGSGFALAFDDSRFEGQTVGDRAGIYGQLVAADGTLLGGNLSLVDDGQVNENPSLALSPERIAVAYTIAPPTGMGTVRMGFRLFDAKFAPVGVVPEPIGVDVQGPTLHFVNDRFIALWTTYPSSGVPGNAVWGAAFDLDGKLILPPRAVTSGANFARFQDALSLGDRLLMAWTDDRDGNFEVYWQVLAPDLSVRDPRQRLTYTQANSVGPSLALGPDGKIGVLYEDGFEGPREAYFQTLECRARTMR